LLLMFVDSFQRGLLQTKAENLRGQVNPAPSPLYRAVAYHLGTLRSGAVTAFLWEGIERKRPFNCLYSPVHVLRQSHSFSSRDETVEKWVRIANLCLDNARALLHN
jgi:hypothetical protein